MNRVIDSVVAHCPPTARPGEQARTDKQKTVMQTNSQMQCTQTQQQKNQRRAQSLLVSILHVPFAKTLPQRLNSRLPKIAFCFSDNLYVSMNYAHVYEGQVDMLGPYLKPCQIVCFKWVNDTLSAFIVTQLDAVEIAEKASAGVWLSTLDHRVLHGERPQNMLEDNRYRLLMEQLYFFNGQLDILANHYEEFLWMPLQFEEKWNFYEQFIVPNRSTNELTSVQRNKLSRLRVVAEDTPLSTGDVPSAPMRLLG
jgi:hypothetical protein